MKTLNGYEVVDAKARQDIEILKQSGGSGDIDLSEYALKSDVPTKVSQLENDANYLTEHQSLDGYATEQYVDDAIANIDIPEGTSTDTYYFDESAFAWDFQTAFLPDDLLEFTQRILNGEKVNLFIKQDGSWYPAALKVSGQDIEITRAVTLDDVGKEQQLRTFDIYYSQYNQTWLARQGGRTKYHIATTDYVDTAITNALSGIATAEGGSY